MLLRDPADRLRSHWAAAWAAGVTSAGFGEWIETQVRAERDRVPPAGPVWSGFYGRHLERYLRHFPSAKIMPILYDDYVRDPHVVLRDVFIFLNVDPEWRSDVSLRHNVTLVPKWPRLHRLTAPGRRVARSVLPVAVLGHMRRWSRRPFHPIARAEDRARAIAVYEDDIRALASLVRRDLSAWLKPKRAR
jgi:hypothetical protein